jgi:hypothetical protein
LTPTSGIPCSAGEQNGFCSPASPARGGGVRGQRPFTETEREIQKSFTGSGLTKWIVISTDYLVICRDYYLDLKGGTLMRKNVGTIDLDTGEILAGTPVWIGVKRSN